MEFNYDPIKLKRIYEEKHKKDGIRLFADRIWPRGLKKSDLGYDEWIKQLCPSTSLIKKWHRKEISYSQFSDHYTKELDTQQHKIDCIAEMAKKNSVTLLSAVKDLEISHLPILKKHILLALEENSFGNSNEYSSPVCYENLQ